MGKIYQNVEALIGKTPLMEVSRIEEEEKLKARIYAKLELFNPAGSVKDRVAFSMILDAEEKGLIGPGATIIEPTSGNTGIGLAAIAASRGYKAIFTMPETMSIERRKLLKGYGAEIPFTRYFYHYQAPESAEKLLAEFYDLEAELQTLLEELKHD